MHRQPRKKAAKKPWWTTSTVLDNMDTFAEPLPMFNLKGKDHAPTHCGGVMTLMIIGVVLIYAIVKFEHMITRYSPQLASYSQDVPPGDKLNL